MFGYAQIEPDIIRSFTQVYPDPGRRPMMLHQKKEVTNMEKWKVFRDKDTGRELCAYTIRGTFPGEEDATRELLAVEEGINPDRITVSIERRKEGRANG